MKKITYNFVWAWVSFYTYEHESRIVHKNKIKKQQNVWKLRFCLEKRRGVNASDFSHFCTDTARPPIEYKRNVLSLYLLRLTSDEQKYNFFSYWGYVLLRSCVLTDLAQFQYQPAHARTLNTMVSSIQNLTPIKNLYTI